MEFFTPLRACFVGLINVYRCLISPFLPPACRFEPTCSQFALESVEVHGIWKGGRMSIRRILRCHPFNPGGFDPVPPRDGAQPGNSIQE